MQVCFRWLVLKDTYLAYIRPEDGVISDVMLMDKEFKVESGMSATGAKHGVLISNLNRWVIAAASACGGFGAASHSRSSANRI